MIKIPLYYNVVVGFYLVVVYIELVGVYIHMVILRIVVLGAINFLGSDIVIDILDYKWLRSIVVSL